MSWSLSPDANCTHHPRLGTVQVRTRGLHFLLMGLLLVALGGLPSRAQEPPPRLSNLTIALWPEHDQPSVLVIMDGTFAAGTELPRTVQVTLPAGVEVNAVAFRDDTAGLLSLPWQTASTDQGQTITFETANPQFLVEYYADIIAPPPNRSFELNVLPPAAADQATLLLRQPSRSNDLVVSPALEPNGVDDLGNPQYRSDLGPLAAGTPVPITVSYDKADEEPSLASSPSASQPPTGPPQSAVPQWQPWVIGALVGLVLAVLAYGAVRWYQGRGGRRGSGGRQARRRAARRGKEKGSVAQPVEARRTGRGQDPFCPQCGNRYDLEDRFCRTCGAPRR